MEDETFPNKSQPQQTNTLGVRGRNVALFERPGSTSSVSDKKYFHGTLKVEPKSKPPKKLKKFHTSVKVRPRKVPLPRTLYNVPVKSLPDAVLKAGYPSAKCRSKTLAQISEADKVSDFERILNSNAILFGARYTTAIADPASAEMFSDVSEGDRRRPLSSYSLLNISETYNDLFQRHLDSLKTVPSRKFSVESNVSEGRMYEDLYNLPEYYDEDYIPIDQIVECSDDVKSSCCVSSNFNVNLSGLISGKDDRVTDEEWPFSMNAPGKSDADIGELERSLCQFHLDERDSSGREVPQITLSECPQCPSSKTPNRRMDNSFSLTVPSVDCDVESRPPVAD